MVRLTADPANVWAARSVKEQSAVVSLDTRLCTGAT
jgi:hypothetical protein